MSREQKLIGLTGVPGAGKSLAAEYLEENGAVIISGDDTGREVLESSPETVAKLSRVLGKGILHADGSLDRKSVGRLVFSDQKKLKKLNSIVHPYLLRLLKSKITRYRKSSPKKLIVVDAALIFEWGIEDWFDCILVVTASRANRIKRLRDSGLTRKEAENRISSQIPQRVKAARADYVIENDGGKSTLRKKVDQFLETLMS